MQCLASQGTTVAGVHSAKREKYEAFVEAQQRLNAAMPPIATPLGEATDVGIVMPKDVPEVSRLVGDVQSTWQAYLQEPFDA
jgi:hypothetical protein